MTKDVIKFVEEASEFFKDSLQSCTYRDEEEKYIGLRYGIGDDCILVYELGEKVQIFENWFDRPTDDMRLDEAVRFIRSMNKLTQSQKEKIQEVIDFVDKYSVEE